MSKTILMAGAAAVVAAGVLTWAVWPDAGSQPSGADPSDPQLVALGQEIYQEQCASCHGGTLQGEPNWRQRKPSGALPAPPHDPTGHTWHHPDQQLFAIIKKGIAPFAPQGYVSDMPGFGGVLSDREIWASLAYIKSTWPKQIRQEQARRTAAAAQSGG